MRVLAHSAVENALAYPKISGHVGHRFSDANKTDGLGFKLCCISFSVVS